MTLDIANLPFKANGETFSASFGRVNVVMGSNGSGKTLLLKAIAAHLLGTGAHAPVYVEGGRSTNLDTSIAIDQNSMAIFTDPEGQERAYLQNRSSTVSQRMTRCLRLLKALEQTRKAAHSDKVMQWRNSGGEGAMPERPKLPLEQFSSIFEGVFPHLRIVMPDQNFIQIQGDNQTYHASQLSDGEKQIFMLTADLLSFKRANEVFLIDEPELNLHPSLAELFWSIVEAELDDATFIYATHSLAFAMRENVESLYLLGLGKVEPSDMLLRGESLRPFLGSFPKIGSKKVCLLVEGDDASIDTPFYQWVLGRKDFSVLPLGGSNEVMLAAARQGLWENHLRAFDSRA